MNKLVAVAMHRLIACSVTCVLLAACAAPAKKEPPATVEPIPAAGSVASLAASIKASAQRSDVEQDGAVRNELANSAIRDADACLALDPKAAACLYGRAVALGLQARLHPTRATQILTNMLEALSRAEAADPGYDEAGPLRVRALVLIRAPGWPVGPGDDEAGLAAARRAVSLKPRHPPNVLALAEALARNGDVNGARENYARARDLAQRLPPSSDRDEWLREADQALKRK